MHGVVNCIAWSIAWCGQLHAWPHASRGRLRNRRLNGVVLYGSELKQAHFNCESCFTLRSIARWPRAELSLVVVSQCPIIAASLPGGLVTYGGFSSGKPQAVSHGPRVTGHGSSAMIYGSLVMARGLRFMGHGHGHSSRPRATQATAHGL